MLATKATEWKNTEKLFKSLGIFQLEKNEIN